MSARYVWAAFVVGVATGCGRPLQPVVAPPPRPAPEAPTSAAAGAPPAAPNDSVKTAAHHDTLAAADTVAVKPYDVTSEALRIFGEAIATPVDSGGVPPPDEPSWDIDVRSYETHRRVEYYIAQFTGQSRERFSMWLVRAGRYESMIRAKLRAAGLPEDLVYLALIESGFNPHAYSRAAAVGIWQFMTTTARGTGLRVDWWVDERRDPVRSTDGAVKFLGWLNDQFGSLYLAAAAYNGGPGRIARGLTRYGDELSGATGEDVFFALAEQDYLRAETKDYVPKLIAAALVAKAPARYGLEVMPEPPLEYDSVRVAAWTPLAAVAAGAGAPVTTIRELNPHLLRGATPPGDSFIVRVPVGSGGGFAPAFAALPAAERKAFTRITTKKGDTMESLARRGGITVRQLSWYNRDLRVSKRKRLAAGQTVLLPTPATLAAALDVPDPSIERYGGSPKGRRVTHVVKRGESLGRIARKYRTTVGHLKRLNRLRKDVIVPGQVILVKGTAPASARHTGAVSAASTAAKGRSTRAAKPCVTRCATAASKQAGKGRTHVVRRGESLTSIARKYDVTVAELKQLNRLRGDVIQAGQKLTVRRK